MIFGLTNAPSKFMQVLTCANIEEYIHIVYTHIDGHLGFVQGGGSSMLAFPRQEIVISNLKILESYNVVKKNTERTTSIIFFFYGRLYCNALKRLISKF